MYKEEEINLQIFHFLDYSTGTSARRKTCTGLTYLLQDWSLSLQAHLPASALTGWFSFVMYTNLLAKSDILGTRERYHCKQVSTSLHHFYVRHSTAVAFFSEVTLDEI